MAATNIKKIKARYKMRPHSLILKPFGRVEPFGLGATHKNGANKKATKKKQAERAKIFS